MWCQILAAEGASSPKIQVELDATREVYYVRFLLLVVLSCNTKSSSSFHDADVQM